MGGRTNREEGVEREGGREDPTIRNQQLNLDYSVLKWYAEIERQGCKSKAGRRKEAATTRSQAKTTAARTTRRILQDQVH